MTLLQILRRLFLVKEIVSREGLVHFQRWRLLQTPWFAIYIHKVARSDEEIHSHDHPWAFRTFVLRGGYREVVHNERGIVVQTLRPGNTAYHPATDFHKITLLDGPTWTLVFTGARSHPVWGYKTESGWVDHVTYRAMKSRGGL
jgi:hypothetical protein